jgi:lysophospholipase L1-like esterase
MMHRVSKAAIALVVLAALAAPAAAAAKAPSRSYFISLGDSYAVGFQGTVGHTTLNGPANQLVKLAAHRGYHFTLVNFGCGGATTTSMLKQIDCPAKGRAPGAPAYPGQTQVQAAVAFITKHPGHVGLATISIGGNDVDGCIPTSDPIGCVRANMPAAVRNLKKIVHQLRAAGGKSMRIIGSTYPDVVLGAWVIPIFGTGRFTLAAESLTAFATYINPGLRTAYASAHAAFVDVTAATGAYGPFTTVDDPTYGVVPKPVAEACRVSLFCTASDLLDIHMTTAGYGIIARLEAATLPRR